VFYTGHTGFCEDGKGSYDAGRGMGKLHAGGWRRKLLNVGRFKDQKEGNNIKIYLQKIR
jgi:hypothetical protein